MIFNTPPASWVVGEQLTPEKLNRNILSAKSQTEEQARKRWKHFDIHYRPSSTVNLARLPLIAGESYVVDRITIEGTYTGSPSISWQRANDSGPIDTWSFDDGAIDGYVNKVLFPGIVLDGYTGSPATHDNDLLITSSAVLPNVAMTISLSSPRQSLSDDATMDSITMYKDQDTLTAARFTADKTTIDNFALDLGFYSHPSAVYLSQFTNVTSAMASYLRQDRIPGLSGGTSGTGDITFVECVGNYEMDGYGAAGQTIKVYSQFTNPGLGETFSVDGQASGTFNLTSIGGTRFNRDISDLTDDVVVQVETNGATTVKKIDIYYIFKTV